MEDLNKFQRKCPTCSKIITYSKVSKKNNAEKLNSKCKSCAYIGISRGKGRKQSEEHIRKRAEAVSKYRTGKTYDEIYGQEKGKLIANNHSLKLTGKKRKPFSQEWKDNMGKSRKNSEVYKKWMNSNEYKNKRREINAFRFYGISLEEWRSLSDEKKLYYQEVRSHTRSQNIKCLENYEKRGKSGKEGAYHLDHIYPISWGYINKIPANIIGNIENLRFIPWETNIQKSNILTEEAKKNIELLILKENIMIQ